MKKTNPAAKWFFAAVIVIIIIFLILYTFIGERESSKSFNPQSAQSTEYMYVVKDYNGKVAVFSGASTTPDEVYDTYTSSLPEPDREYLKEGIKINSVGELESIIEDLTS